MKSNFADLGIPDQNGALDLCGARWFDDGTDGDEMENDYRRLCNEIMRLMLDQELFVFVTETAVEGSNNAAERQLRDDATARKTAARAKPPGPNRSLRRQIA